MRPSVSHLRPHLWPFLGSLCPVMGASCSVPSLNFFPMSTWPRPSLPSGLCSAVTSAKPSPATCVRVSFATILLTTGLRSRQCVLGSGAGRGALRAKIEVSAGPRFWGSREGLFPWFSQPSRSHLLSICKASKWLPPVVTSHPPASLSCSSGPRDGIGHGYQMIPDHLPL